MDRTFGSFHHDRLPVRCDRHGIGDRCRVDQPCTRPVGKFEDGPSAVEADDGRFDAGFHVGLAQRRHQGNDVAGPDPEHCRPGDPKDARGHVDRPPARRVRPLTREWSPSGRALDQNVLLRCASEHPRAHRSGDVVPRHGDF